MRKDQSGYIKRRRLSKLREARRLKMLEQIRKTKRYQRRCKGKKVC